jgi:thioredoxin reductase (NADPH)
VTHHTITIVGGGPAGIACAVQLYHSGLRPLLIERDQLGGLLRSANWVENYPGFPGGIKGIELARLFAQQLMCFKPGFLSAAVRLVDWDEKQFQIESGEQSFTAEMLVIATGTKPKPQPAFCRKPEFVDRIFSEIFPLLDEKGKSVAIIGSGDAAFDYALNLASANDVTIFSRSAQPKCLPLLEAAVRLNPHIHCYLGWDVSGISLDTDGKLLLSTRSISTESNIPFDYLLFAIGREPNLGRLSPSVINARDELEARGRLHFIGDVINGNMRQTAIAVGQGVRAAMGILKWQHENT